MPVVEGDRPGGQRQAQRQELELSDGAGRVHRAKWRARCWGDTLLLFLHYILYTIHYTHTHPLFTPHTPHCSRFRVATILVQCTRVPKLG